MGAQVTENLIISSTNFFSPKRIASGRATLNVPLYQGGGVKNAIRAADARVDAGQANLRGTESGLFSQVVAAYLDVIRDGSIATLNAKQVQVLSKNLEATRDRFEVGDLTRTDIAQSESRLAIARLAQFWSPPAPKAWRLFSSVMIQRFCCAICKTSFRTRN